MQAFQGSYVGEIYSEKSPLARILTTVYRVRHIETHNYKILYTSTKLRS